MPPSSNVHTLSVAAGLGAAFIAFVATSTLIARFVLRLQMGESPLDALTILPQYFTILTNALTHGLMV